MENKILIHADINLNVVDGATIWWSNTINVFIQGGIDIIYISNYKITNDSNLRNIENKSKLNIINPDKNLNPTETLKKIEEYDDQVNKIILRSKLILDIINENWSLLRKTIIYGLDIHLNSIKKLNNKFKKVWTQSEKLKKLFETNEINNVKIVPVVAYKYDFNLPKRNDNEIRLVYTGTLCQEENTIEIIEEFQKINKERPEVVLKICYGKIHGDSNFINKVNTYIKNGVRGITFKYNLSHKDTCYEIITSDIGICWRKNEWGDNGEVSTKVKEYKLYGLFLINDIKLLRNKKYNINKNNIIINNVYTINNNDIILDNIINENINIVLNNKPTINVKFNEEFQLLFNNPLFSDIFNYDYTYKYIKNNQFIKINLYKNVFYKLNCSYFDVKVYLYHITDINKKENIFRNLLHNYNNNKDIYFNVKHSGEYYLNLRTNIKSSFNIKIENYISLNYLCGDNVYMINLKNKQENFKINSLILNKIGIDIKRIEACNGNDSKYDDIWNKYYKLPFNEDDKMAGRKVLSRGSFGYLFTMEKIFSNLNSKYVAIFDDDIIINNKLNIELISTNLIKLSNFNIIKFGSSQRDFTNINLNKYFYCPNDSSNGSFACIYNSTTYNKILEKIKLFNKPFDSDCLTQFNKDKLYIINPNLIIANLDNVSTILNRKRINDYKLFRWNLNNYIKLPYIENTITLIENKNNNKTHFYIGITSFKRDNYLKETLNSLILTLNNDYFFTILIAKGLDLLDKEDKNFENYLKEIFNKFTNVNLIINYSYLHYIYYSSNYILKYSNNINYDFGFILNDDILFKNDWYIEYYKSSIKNNIQHLCWLENNNNTVYINEKKLKHKGDVLKSNGVLLTFNKNVVDKVGYFNETEYKVRGQSHLEWSFRCCNAGFNNKYTFYDIINSKDLISLNTKNYTTGISNTPYLDKVIHFVDKYELERRNKILTL